eukprot:tig00020710_g13253.t1
MLAPFTKFPGDPVDLFRRQQCYPHHSDPRFAHFLRTHLTPKERAALESARAARQNPDGIAAREARAAHEAELQIRKEFDMFMPPSVLRKEVEFLGYSVEEVIPVHELLWSKYSGIREAFFFYARMDFSGDAGAGASASELATMCAGFEFDPTLYDAGAGASASELATMGAREFVAFCRDCRLAGRSGLPVQELRGIFSAVNAVSDKYYNYSADREARSRRGLTLQARAWTAGLGLSVTERTPTYLVRSRPATAAAGLASPASASISIPGLAALANGLLEPEGPSEGDGANGRPATAAAVAAATPAELQANDTSTLHIGEFLLCLLRLAHARGGGARPSARPSASASGAGAAPASLRQRLVTLLVGDVLARAKKRKVEAFREQLGQPTIQALLAGSMPLLQRLFAAYASRDALEAAAGASFSSRGGSGGGGARPDSHHHDAKLMSLDEFTQCARPPALRLVDGLD